MAEPLIEAVESLPPGSKAPEIVALIYSMPDLELKGKRAMAAMFLAGYRLFIEESLS